MDCPYCDHPKTHKHSKTSKESQRDKCAHCTRMFVETFDTLYYWRQVSADEVEKSFNRKRKGAVYVALAASKNGTYNTVVSIVHLRLSM